ncbi:MAG: hypothetical protein SOV24_01010 [Muribaculaceae bacterium]|nr:hypothetical protein [Bacteroidales bacterium]MDD6942999.1 hypothetical protein [Bacteroidales bacterium]MDY2732935.1 hypothetical protein [Muribaculaceae bacterium]MDY4649132.1 hypothetical protein [Muribaculaceae bacterium]MDY5388040.1 hypothetical protein [Muribaculaceae bacterium]
MPKLSPNNDLPKAIRNIRLCAALKNCGAISVADAFDKSSAMKLYVYDDRDLGYTDWDDIEPTFVAKCFIATNSNDKTIVLLPLDGRILTGRSIIEGGICDGMLLTDHEMCLVEFKTNTFSSNYQTILQRANEAILQLWHTFNGIIKPKCATKSINVDQILSVDFYVVFNKDLEVTGANSELMDLQMQFLTDNNHPLYFNSGKTFL